MDLSDALPPAPPCTATTPCSSPSGFDPEPQAPEAALVSRLRAGDPEAFRQLIERHTPHLTAVARRYLPCDADAEDAVQEAFITAFTHMHQFKAESKLSTWLHRIVVNAALMSRRKRSRRREAATLDSSLAALAAPRNWEHPGDLRERAASTLADAERILDHIEQLPDCYREVLDLRHVQNQTTDRSAQLLGVTPGALKTKLHRAKRRLHGRIERDPHLRHRVRARCE